MNIRKVPKDPSDRYVGEGDIVLRDKSGRIIAYKAGYDDASWEALKKHNPGSYGSVARWDTDLCQIV